MKLSQDLFRSVYGRHASPAMERRHVIGVTYRQQKRRRRAKKTEGQWPNWRRFVNNRMSRCALNQVARGIAMLEAVSDQSI